MLADKYNVGPVYQKCVDVIENALKVYLLTKINTPNDAPQPSCSGCDDGGHKMDDGIYNPAADFIRTGGEDSNSNDGLYRLQAGIGDNALDQIAQVGTSSKQTTHLVASETFQLSVVIKLLRVCQNERITNAALYNMEARLSSQFRHQNFGRWNDLDKDLVITMLSDKHFFCNEYLLFVAAKSWVMYQPERQSEDVLTDVLTCIRYGTLDTKDLYVVEKDILVKQCSALSRLVHQAIRFKLFNSCVAEREESDEWTGLQFERRTVREA